MQALDFGHHFFVDRQTAGSVDEQHIVVMPLCPVKRRQGNRLRLLAGGRREEINAGLPGHRLQLLNSRRTVNVAGNDQNLLFVIFLEELAELADRGRLARPLQAGHQDNRRRLRIEVDTFMRVTHQAGQFGMHDADQGLPGTQRADDFLADRLFLDGGNELLDHRQGDVGLEQRHADFAQGIGNIGFSQAGFALERLHDAGKAIGQVIEHG